MTDRELMQMALDALEGAITYDWHGNPSEDYDRECAALVTALRERLKQPAAEVEEGCTPADARKLREANHELAQENYELLEALKSLVRINEQHDEAIAACIGRPLDWKDAYLDRARAVIARAIEAKLKEKNNA